MNSIKEETYNEICDLYKKSLLELSNEISNLKIQVYNVKNENDALKYKLIDRNIELKYKNKK
jgi:hypothetical protein